MCVAGFHCVFRSHSALAFGVGLFIYRPRDLCLSTLLTAHPITVFIALITSRAFVPLQGRCAALREVCFSFSHAKDARRARLIERQGRKVLVAPPGAPPMMPKLVRTLLTDSLMNRMVGTDSTRSLISHSRWGRGGTRPSIR